MNEPIQDRDAWEDVELLIRAAGRYVVPSEDMRPRVLEAARVESDERKARRRVWHMAIAIGVLGAMFIVANDRTSVLPIFSHGMLANSDLHPAEEGAAGWGIVDAFTDLRRRQAALLSLDRSPQ